MTPSVLDAFAVLAWMQNEPGADLVEEVLDRAERRQVDAYISIVNAGEVRYRLAKLGPPGSAEAFVNDLRRKRIPVRVMPATNRRVWAAAELKSKYLLSYADAFAVGLARELRGSLVTGDPEMKAVVQAGLVEVAWLPFRRQR